MIVSKTPLRVSLFGGGTDFPEYFNRKKAFVIGGTINKYIYITVNKFYSRLFDHKIRLFYKKTEEYNKIYSSCTIGREGQSTNGIEVDVDLSDANKIVRASNFF